MKILHNESTARIHARPAGPRWSMGRGVEVSRRGFPQRRPSSGLPKRRDTVRDLGKPCAKRGWAVGLMRIYLVESHLWLDAGKGQLM